MTVPHSQLSEHSKYSNYHKYYEQNCTTELTLRC